MVKQVSKRVICSILLAIVITLPLGSVALAKDYTAYEGNISNTYTTYFKDILSNVPINENYVYFRSGQYDYDLVVGDIEFVDGVFVLVGEGKQYTITNGSNNYNSTYSYSVSNIDHFTLIPDDKLVYSDLGDFPVLEERSDRFEYIQTISIVAIGLCCVIRGIFNSSKRE